MKEEVQLFLNIIAGRPDQADDLRNLADKRSHLEDNTWYLVLEAQAWKDDFF